MNVSMSFNMSIASNLLARKKMLVVIASLAIVTAFMIPYDVITDAFAARGGGGGSGSGGGSGGCEPYCHVRP
jgi:hypothetical protein